MFSTAESLSTSILVAAPAGPEEADVGRGEGRGLEGRIGGSELLSSLDDLPAALVASRDVYVWILKLTILLRILESLGPCSWLASIQPPRSSQRTHGSGCRCPGHCQKLRAGPKDSGSSREAPSAGLWVSSSLAVGRILAAAPVLRRDIPLGAGRAGDLGEAL